MKSMLKGKKGITLIALVVTIIVLIILAGISINLLIGENGIITRAKDVAVEQMVGQRKEAVGLALKSQFAKNQGNKSQMTVEGVLGELRTALNSNTIYAKKGDSEIRELTGETPIDGAVRFYFPAEINGSTNKEIVVTVDSNLNITGAATTEVANNNQQEELPEDSIGALAKAGVIQRWDKINYNPGNGTTESINLPAGASLNKTIIASYARNWVVLDVTQDGDVLIIPTTVSSTRLGLSGMDGYNNAIRALDTVAGIYLNSDYATAARSITIEDINKVENHTPNGQFSSRTWNNRYGMDSNLNIKDAGEGNAPSQTYTSTATTGFYGYNTTCFKDMQDFWIASRCVFIFNDYDSEKCYFRVRMHRSELAYDETNVSFGSLFDAKSDGGIETYSNYSYVIPVVTLKSNIQLEANGTTYAGTETATGTATATGTGTGTGTLMPVVDRIGEHNIWNIK